MSAQTSMNRARYAAAVIFVVIVIWVAAGHLGEQDVENNTRPLTIDHALMKVQVTALEGQLVQRDVEVSARTEANRRVHLKSEIRAKVIAIHRQQGDHVEAGDVILELDARDWPARVKQAQAAVKQAQLEANSARRLAKSNLANESELARADANLASAEAELIQAQVQLDATRITAPFAGVVDERLVEIGDFVQDGSELVRVLDFDPVLITGQVAETDAADISMGDYAWADLVNGERVHGQIQFMSADANPQTRTFQIEMAINPQDLTFAPASGLTAHLHIPQPDVYAYSVSPALLILNDNGQLGLKGVDRNDEVIFLPVQLLKADEQGIWVYGPGDQADIITIGQGFVDYGEKVQVIRKTDSSSDDAALTASPKETRP